MAKENDIVQLFHEATSLSAREITDRLYDEHKHQSVVFGRLQKMEARGIVKKDKSEWPYRWSLVSKQTPVRVSESISQRQISLPKAHKAPTTQIIKTVTHNAQHKKIVALISCTGSKRGREGFSCEARLLYDTSPFFPISLAYAEIIADDIYVISAEYHLVELDRVIKWYNKTLNDFSSDEAAAWGNIVVGQISERYDVSETEFVILAGQKYYIPIIKRLPYPPKLPLRHANGFDRQKTERETLYMCARLHNIFNNLPRLHWDTIDDIAFDNGIYILFEDGEAYYGMDRIVRVGTHRSDGRLRRRLKDHFISENKDGSIFRKNIGKAILKKKKNPYLNVWSVDTSKQEKIIRLGDSYDPIFQKKVEENVTKYMRDHLSFVCFPVATEQERLRLEEGIIAALNRSSDFTSSSEWRGKYSTEHEIVQSGMWLKQGLDGIPLAENEYKDIAEYCSVVSPDRR